MGVFDKLLSGGLLGAGSSLISGIANAFSTNKANNTSIALQEDQQQFADVQARNQMNFQERLYNDAKANQWAMFEATNKYNSPEAQRQRYEAAGINPYLAMSGTTSGVATSVAGPSSPSGAAGSPPSTAPIIPMKFDDPINAMATATRALYDAFKAEEEIKGYGLDNDAKSIQNEYLPRQLASEISERLASTRDKDAKAAYQEILNGYADDMIASQTEEARYRAMAAFQNVIRSDIELQYLPAEKQIALSTSFANLIYAIKTNQKADKEMRHLDEQITQLRKQNYITEKSKQYLIDKAKWEAKQVENNSYPNNIPGASFRLVDKLKDIYDKYTSDSITFPDGTKKKKGMYVWYGDEFIPVSEANEREKEKSKGKRTLYIE